MGTATPGKRLKCVGKNPNTVLRSFSGSSTQYFTVKSILKLPTNIRPTFDATNCNMGFTAALLQILNCQREESRAVNLINGSGWILRAVRRSIGRTLAAGSRQVAVVYCNLYCRMQTEQHHGELLNVLIFQSYTSRYNTFLKGVTVCIIVWKLFFCTKSLKTLIKPIVIMSWHINSQLK